jgi:transcriptional regulator
MYADSRFHVSDRAQIREFIERYPLATLVAFDGANVAATHLPLLIHEWGDALVLRGHVMRDSDHGRALQRSPSIFASFVGPDAPILGSWQLTPGFGGTWNYMAVHIRGEVHFPGDDVLVEHLAQLKNSFETSPAHRFDSLPAGYVAALTPMIQCIDLRVSDIQCIFKLSQNRCLDEFDLTAQHLQRRGDKSALVAAEMLARRNQYYPNAASRVAREDRQ